ncbi:hypothetical protein XBI1_1920033 [Xenorhabdus bovienii str. Intermedium]|uniref:Uncharacterized protein n=1 Tax=Xenorhabdus bovienii str. Intermedium TaxID=1379677 RepID=A0A077QFW3_XENBV|nr:hypothetical protein XBI1_1920033 [Xenorhabdus bovienii str. Intermedium]
MIFSLYKNNYLVDYLLLVVMLIIIFYEDISQRNLLFKMILLTERCCFMNALNYKKNN